MSSSSKRGVDEISNEEGKRRNRKALKQAFRPWYPLQVDSSVLTDPIFPRLLALPLSSFKPVD